MKVLKTQKGITLIALVITIIVLIILAGITISMLIGENGIIERAKEAKQNTQIAQKEEEENLKKAEEQINKEIADDINNPALQSLKFLIRIENGMVIDLPVEGTDGASMTIDWGDGTKDIITRDSQPVSHTYGNGMDGIEEEHIVSITGTCKKITQIDANVDMRYIIEVLQWGTTGLESIDFNRSQNLRKIAAPTANSFKNMTNFSYSFRNCTALEELPANFFDSCPHVTDFICTFQGCISLKGDPIPLWERVPNGSENDYIGIPDGGSCYLGCKQLNNYYAIPEYWRAQIAE